MACLVVLFGSVPAMALEASNVLVLYNAESSDSFSIATYYAQIHTEVKILGLYGLPEGDIISSSDYFSLIRPQVLAALGNSVDCIVTTKGLPLKIYNPAPAGAPVKWNTYSSLESELTRIDTISSALLMGNQDWLLPGCFGGNELSRNPYYLSDNPFSYANYGIRLTSRLDGFSVQDVNAAVDRAQKAVFDRPGYGFIIDDDPNAPATNSDRFAQLAATLQQAGIEYTYDNSSVFLTEGPQGVLGYFSHGKYSGAPAEYIQEALNFTPVPGAIFQTYESFNAYGFNDGDNRYGQGLLAEWLAIGGTAGVGYVEEPGAGSLNLTDESNLIARMLEGWTFAEAVWNSNFQLSYVNTLVGDPLMTFNNWLPGDADLDGDVDAVDIQLVKAAYNTNWGDPGYSLLADMNADGKIDLWDVVFTQSMYTGAAVPYLVPDGTPEPASLLLFLPGIAALLRRRK